MKKMVCVLMALAMLAGCSAPQPTAVAPSESPLAVAPTPTPSENVVIVVETPKPQMEDYNILEGYSPTTGLPSQKGYKPVLVAIANESGARPQWNISLADIVYEIEVEGSMTRLAALYNDNTPDKTGPIRSARVNFFDIAKEWDGILAHYGGPDAGNGAPSGADIKIKRSQLGFETSVNGMSVGKLFKRDSARRAPSNVYASVTELQQHFDYTPKPHAMMFDLNGSVKQEGDAALSVTLDLRAGGKVAYEYDTDSGVYARSVGGKKFSDGVTGEQLSFSNIIVQKAAHSRISGSDKHIGVKLIGEGEAVYYIDGVAIKGKWRRDDIDDRTHYLDEDGNLLYLKPGKTVIHITREDVGITIK
ncbi:MAG: DUF3048 domain-containing protein [Christensenellales bacterium]|jgi:hypothetical protein